MKRIFLVIVFLPLFIYSLCSCAPTQRKYSTQFLGAFDTVTVITGFAQSKAEFDKNTKLIFDKLLEYHKLFDIYNSYENINNIKTINDNRGIKPVAVDKNIIELLTFSKEMYELSNGNINIAMGSVLKIWHDHRQEATTIPSKSELETAQMHTDIDSVIINPYERTVFLSDPQVLLDVGAVAKGFAVEKVCNFAFENGISSFVLNVGGNVRTVGTKPDNNNWDIGITSPLDISKFECVVSVSDTSIVTSGVYQRFFEVDGKKYHHIIDPETSFPSDKYSSVTVVCPDSAIADALSTALFNMDIKDGKKVIEKLKNVDVLWITNDGSKTSTVGFDKITK